MIPIHVDLLALLSTGSASPAELHDVLPEPRPSYRTVARALVALVANGRAQKVDRGRYEAVRSCPIMSESLRTASDTVGGNPVFARARQVEKPLISSTTQSERPKKALTFQVLGGRDRARAGSATMPRRWLKTSPGAEDLLDAVREILEPCLRAGESLEKKLADVTRFDRERVCEAVAHCWLLEARSRRVKKNMAAAFWWALGTAKRSELEEGAVANLDEVQVLVERACARGAR